MSALLDYRYWINTNPVAFGPSLLGSILVFFGWFVLASCVVYALAWYFNKRNRLLADSARPFAKLLLVTGLLGWCFLFFTYERIPLFGMRIWFLVLAIHFFVKLVKISLRAAREYPAAMNMKKERERKEKYMPKRA